MGKVLVVMATWVGLLLSVVGVVATSVLVWSTVKFQRWTQRQRNPEPAVLDIAVHEHQTVRVMVGNPGETPIHFWRPMLVVCTPGLEFGSKEYACEALANEIDYIPPREAREFEFNVMGLDEEVVKMGGRVEVYMAMAYIREGRLVRFVSPRLLEKREMGSLGMGTAGMLYRGAYDVHGMSFMHNCSAVKAARKKEMRRELRRGHVRKVRKVPLNIVRRALSFFSRK